MASRVGVRPFLAATLLPFLATLANADDNLITGLATYSLSLNHIRPGAPLESAAGRIAIFLERPACDAYRTTTHFDLHLTSVAGLSIDETVAETLEEGPNSLRFDESATAGPGKVASAGLATRTPDGLTVALTVPEAKTVTFPADTLFPIAMMRAALAAARSGNHFAQFHLYDGSGDGAGIYSVTAVIGEEGIGPVGDQAPIAGKLDLTGVRHWPMTLSYFKGDSPDPVQTSEAIIYENGYTRSGAYDYGNFGLALDLVGFDLGKPLACP